MAHEPDPRGHETDSRPVIGVRLHVGERVTSRHTETRASRPRILRPCANGPFMRVVEMRAGLVLIAGLVIACDHGPGHAPAPPMPTETIAAVTSIPSSDGQLVVSLDPEGALDLFDTRTGTASRLQVPGLDLVSSGVGPCAWAPRRSSLRFGQYGHGDSPSAWLVELHADGTVEREDLNTDFRSSCDWLDGGERLACIGYGVDRRLGVVFRGASDEPPHLWEQPMRRGANAAFSPDGASIVYADACAPADLRDCFYRADIDGRVRARLGRVDRLVCGLVFTPDGSRVVFTTRGLDRCDRLAVLDPVSGEMHAIAAFVAETPGTYDGIAAFAPSPDGSHVAVVSDHELTTAPDWDDERLFTLAIDGTDRHRVSARFIHSAGLVWLPASAPAAH